LRLSSYFALAGKIATHKCLHACCKEKAKAKENEHHLDVLQTMLHIHKARK
jgi:hypothetical protein